MGDMGSWGFNATDKRLCRVVRVIEILDCVGFGICPNNLRMNICFDCISLIKEWVWEWVYRRKTLKSYQGR